METLHVAFKRLPWRIIKTTISVIVAVAILPTLSYFLFRYLIPVYPFIFVSHHETVYIGSSATALYFAAMAATKGVGNTLQSTWKAISSQMVSNFFGAAMGVIISSTLAEMWGPTNPFTIGIGIFLLYLILKYLHLNEAFTLGGITFITIVVLSTSDYPPLVRGIDRFYSMAIGLIVSGLINLIFLSPKKSPKHLFAQLLAVQKRFCLQENLNCSDYQFIDAEMKKIQKDTSILIQDESIEKKIFFWRKQEGFDRHQLHRYVKQCQLLLQMEVLNQKSTMSETFDEMYLEFKKKHYQLMKQQQYGDIGLLLEKMREWLFEHHKQIENVKIVQFLDYLNEYEQLLIKE